MKTYRKALLMLMAMLLSSGRLFGQAAGGDPSTFPMPGRHPSPNNGRDFSPPATLPDGKAEQDQLLAAVKWGGPVFTATVGEMQVLAQTAGVPPTVAMNVVFKDLAMLRGQNPPRLRFAYSARQWQRLVPEVGQKVIVVARFLVLPPPPPDNAPPPPDHAEEVALMPTILVIAEATDANLAAVKAAIAQGQASQPDAAKAPAAGAEIHWGKAVGNLQLGISTGQGQWPAGQPMDFVVHLRNVGEEACKVPQTDSGLRLVFASTAGWGGGDNGIWMAHFSGKEAAAPLNLKVGQNRRIDVTIPGAWVLTKEELGQDVPKDRLPPGEYRVHVQYSDPNDATAAGLNPRSGDVPIRVVEPAALPANQLH